MLYWIYAVPNWALAILFSAFFVGFTWTGVLLTRPIIRRRVGSQPEHNDLVSYFLSAYGVFYGLTLGLLAVGTYENFSDVEGIAGREATAMGALYRDVSSYPDPMRGELQVLVREYCRFVIEDAWPAHRKGQVHHGGIPRVNAIQTKLVSFEPATKSQEALHADTLRQFNVFFDLRHQRMQSVTTGLPAPLWYVVIVGALLNIVLTWLFSIDRLDVHLLLSGLLSLLIGLLIFLLAAMDNPFRGEFSVGPDAFELIRDTLMKPDAS